jgi:hypothetical protein
LVLGRINWVVVAGGGRRVLAVWSGWLLEKNLVIK